MKRARKSKIIWLNSVAVLLGLASEFWPEIQKQVCESHAPIGRWLALLGVINVILRRFCTKLPLGLLFLISGCVTGTPEGMPLGTPTLSPDLFYARNIEFEISGAKCRGTCVVARAPKYEIRIKSRGDLDFLLIRSCHREISREKEGDEFRFTYEPVPGVEDNRACPLSFVGVEKGKNRRALGWVGFQDPRRVLGASTKFNGKVAGSPGVSAVESGAGLIQRIEFDVPVEVEAPGPGCNVFTTQDSRAFEFKIPRGSCTVLFMERALPNRTHTLFTYGYDEILPGEV